MSDSLVLVCGTGVLQTFAHWMTEHPDQWRAVPGVNPDLERTAPSFFRGLDDVDHENSPARQDNAFPGSSSAFAVGGTGACESVDAVVASWSRHLRRKWWTASIETRALHAYEDEFQARPDVTLVSAAQLQNRWGNALLTKLLHLHKWKLAPQQPLSAARQGLDANGMIDVIDQLRSVLQTSRSGRLPTVVLAGGFKDLHRAVTLMAAAFDLDVLTLADQKSQAKPELLRIAGPETADDAPVVAHLECIRFEPAEVFRRRSGEESLCSTEALDRMASRTRTWVRGDVWQGDRLTFMMQHDAEHGRRVDRLSNTLLRLTDLLKSVDTAQRDFAHEALSAAAWLHDVGQRGAMLGQEYVRDPEHVRLAHGALSSQVIDEDPASFGFKQDEQPGLTRIVRALCRCHQRTTQLADEPFRPWKCPLGGSSCPLCDEIRPYVLEPKLRDVAQSIDYRVEQVLGPDLVVALGAILRVADASDIGTHRVNGRWEVGAHSIEESWRREQLWDYLASLPESVREKAAVATRDLFCRRWNEALPSVRAKLLSSALDGLSGDEKSEVIDRMEAIDELLASQVNHAAKHLWFAGSQVVVDGNDGFRLRVTPSRHWMTADSSQQEIAFREAASYIGKEYLHVERLFEDLVSRRLRGVDGPGGLSHSVDDFRSDHVREQESWQSKSH